MSLKLKPYPEYKDSEVPWIDAIPSRWELVRTKSLFRLCTEKAPPDHGFDLLSIYTHIGVKPRKELEERGNKASSTDEYWIVKPGDIIVNKLLAWMGAVGVSHYEGVTSPAYDILRKSRPLNPDFYHYLFRTGLYLSQFKSRSRGIMDMRLRLYFDQFGQIPLLSPPLQEQNAIVSFLRHLDHHVSHLIRAKRRLIELLNEQKQVIIHRAVTQGLEPTVRFRQSGIDRLGSVPEHWISVRLGRVVDILTGFPFKSEGFTQNPEDVPLLRGINVAPGRVRWDQVVRWPKLQADALGQFALRKGDIVLGMDRPIVKSGIRVAALSGADVPCLLLQRVACLRSHSELDQRYLLMLLQDSRYADYLAPIFTGISVPHISPSQISDYRVALPPIEEQVLIVKHVLDQTHSTEKALDLAEREIKLIREYRTRLIADVLTGKLDVRGVELPAMGDAETFEDLESLDEIDTDQVEEIEVNLDDDD